MQTVSPSYRTWQLLNHVHQDSDVYASYFTQPRFPLHYFYNAGTHADPYVGISSRLFE